MSNEKVKIDKMKLIAKSNDKITMKLLKQNKLVQRFQSIINLRR